MCSAGECEMGNLILVIWLPCMSKSWLQSTIVGMHIPEHSPAVRRWPSGCPQISP